MLLWGGFIQTEPATGLPLLKTDSMESLFWCLSWKSIWQTKQQPKSHQKVSQKFADSGSHAAVHGNCCYDKKRYRVTSAVHTMHNQLERNAKHYNAIYTCCCGFPFPLFMQGLAGWNWSRHAQRNSSTHKSERMMEEQQQWERRKWTERIVGSSTKRSPYSLPADSRAGGSRNKGCWKKYLCEINSGERVVMGDQDAGWKKAYAGSGKAK